MSELSYKNRRGDRYYLHVGRTKTGKPRYFIAKTHGEGTLDAMPEGYEFAVCTLHHWRLLRASNDLSRPGRVVLAAGARAASQTRKAVRWKDRDRSVFRIDVNRRAGGIALGKRQKAGKEPEWRNAKKLCRLNGRRIAMARALDMNPKKLPGLPQPETARNLPVGAFIEECCRKRIGGEPISDKSCRPR
jgi:hypothetical protein